MKNKKSIVLLSSLLVLSGCSGNLDNNKQDSRIVMAKEAASSLSFMSGLVGQKTVLNKNALRSTTPDLYENYDPLIRPYLPIVEDILLSEKFYTINTDTPSDKDEYQQMDIIEYKDLNSNLNTFILYYNETLKNDDEHDETDDFEVESTLNGVVVFGEEEFKIKGEKELDRDEIEMKFEFYWKDNYFIRVEQEIENDESEFKYTFYDNGVKSYEFSLELESENGEKKLNLKEKTLNEKIKAEFSIFVGEDTTYIKCTVDDSYAKNNYLYKKVINPETNMAEFVLNS